MSTYTIAGHHVQITPFYSKHAPLYELTNFDTSTPVKIDHIKWATTEHYFQAKKFPKGSAQYNAIRFAPTSKVALQKAQQFTQNWTATDWSNWNAKKEKVMEKALREKLAQHPKVKAKLVATGKTCLVEDTAPRDEREWGWGKDGLGNNKLGKLWMKLRNEEHAKHNNHHLVVNVDNIWKQAKTARHSLGSSPKMMQDLVKTDRRVTQIGGTARTFTPSYKLRQSSHYQPAHLKGFGKTVSQCFYDLLGIRVSVGGSKGHNLSLYLDNKGTARALENWLRKKLHTSDVYLQSQPESFNGKTMYRISVKSHDVRSLLTQHLHLGHGFTNGFKHKYKIH